MTPEINTNVDGIKDYPIEMTFVASNETGTKTVINGETITWESMSLDERQRVVNAFAGGYGLFAGFIDVEQEASEVQLR